MRLTIEPTSRVVDVEGVPARVWEGRNEQGVSVVCLVTRVAVDRAEDQGQFEAELQKCPPPGSAGGSEAFPMRMLL